MNIFVLFCVQTKTQPGPQIYLSLLGILGSLVQAFPVLVSYRIFFYHLEEYSKMNDDFSDLTLSLVTVCPFCSGLAQDAAHSVPWERFI